MGKTIDLLTDKLEHLAKHLGVNTSEIIPLDPDEFIFEYQDQEYLVCTEEESINKAYDYVENNLWAFNAKFLVKYMPWIDFFNDKKEQALVESLRIMQEKLCEDCNPIIYKLIGKRIHDLFNEAVRLDGMGHLLAQYDFIERAEGDFFIYRTN